MRSLFPFAATFTAGLAAAIGLTLQDILDRVRAHESLSPKQRQERISAITSACKWLNRSPAEVPAEPAWLRVAFFGLTPAGSGVSVGRFANVRSSIKTTLEDCGISIFDSTPSEMYW